MISFGLIMTRNRAIPRIVSGGSRIRFLCVSDARSHITKLNVVRIQVTSWPFKTQKSNEKAADTNLKDLAFFVSLCHLETEGS
jgi:hypothetical protein